jgi:septal ring factor EnvC (AmiA/AmiB activator)
VAVVAVVAVVVVVLAPPPPPCAVRTQMKEADHAHQGQIEVLKEDMKALKQRSMTATEAMQRMQLEVRARRLESESLTREVNSVAETSEEHEKNLQKAEQSRSALLNELDRTRRDKTDMVKAMVEERNSAADEAGKTMFDGKDDVDAVDAVDVKMLMLSKTLVIVGQHC